MTTLKDVNGRVVAASVPALHLYRNQATDWFAAASLEHAKLVAREHYAADDLDEDDVAYLIDGLEFVPDDKLLTLDDEETETKRQQTAFAWANENGPGFWATTNY